MAGCSNRTRQGCAVALSQASSLRDPLGAGGPAQFLGTRGKETLQYVEGPFAAAPGGNKCKAVLWGASPCSASSPFLSCHGATPAMSLDSPDKVILFFFPISGAVLFFFPALTKGLLYQGPVFNGKDRTEPFGNGS